MGNNFFSAQNSPLTAEQAALLNQLIGDLSPEQRTWISGYLAGLNAATIDSVASQVAATTVSNTSDPITVLFGSQTGNAEKLAEKLCTRLTEAGLTPNLCSMSNYKPRQLKKESYLFIIASTHGEGDPPDNAEIFHEFLHSTKAPKLEELEFSVLALGDSSYEFFCKTGHDFDSRLHTLGGKRILDCVSCDVDYEEEADAWIANVVQTLSQKLTTTAQSVSNPLSIGVANNNVASTYSKKNPFLAPLLENIQITGRGSSKEVRHIALSLEDSSLSFKPGDALGVVPTNHPELVAELIEALGFSSGEKIANAKEEEISLDKALSHEYEITTITRPFLEKYATLAESQELKELLKEENRERLRKYIYGRELIDIIQTYPIAGITANQFIGLLRKLPPRLYSIASSYQANPDEVHLTVAIVRYKSYGRSRCGVATTFLAERIPEDGTVPIYIDSNKNFHLPENPDAPIIMVGPGTGVAPFRAFLEEREFLEAQGKNWLFFGDRNFHTDFLYQQEWIAHRKSGLLTKIDVAFSRDDSRKTYVQHRMLEHSNEIYAWLEEGAYFYVCGDAESMAPDVHEALLTIVEKEGDVSRERATEYVRDLQQNKRYQRDVY
ncbi:assimilatory sulfite reductase (NADPH) flavoprotein subunit [Candidatus Nitrosacidococcus tergens]|uniref:Sulfite reductase [NADPH] flavoprotein alpha-component n=1 Tax=Candidatus Nitrosacidococcus tergens TaxID=553981 RepID=A0A7G1Q954_9GAMM|nr:assimilatory sulfite reductase (NADPH) flavoprotein subunit [Candidatus Nitrosacidococcus tergens]CAB1275209.1 Sulfite reductase [NADPH] flavoprotein, alpha subunit [Candidatus Nitrosacidococcus tergens]